MFLGDITELLDQGTPGVNTPYGFLIPGAKQFPLFFKPVGRQIFLLSLDKSTLTDPPHLYFKYYSQNFNKPLSYVLFKIIMPNFMVKPL